METKKTTALCFFIFIHNYSFTNKILYEKGRLTIIMKHVTLNYFTRHSVILSVLAILLVIALVPTGIAIGNYVHATVNEFVLGDVDIDGSVTAADARLALRAAVGLENYKSGSDKFKRADYDGSGVIEASDARSILRVAVGLSGNEGPDNVISVDDPGNNDPLYYLGGKHDKSRAGLYYYNGVRVKYEDIPEGASYVYYDQNGNRHGADKPYSPGNEPTARDVHHCPYCGKSTDMDLKTGKDACQIGGCDRWIIDINCPHCGKFVPANTCHTCGK